MIIFVMTNNISTLAKNGAAHVQAFNLKTFLSFFGTSIYAFEGVTMLLPLQISMAEPHRLPSLVSVGGGGGGCWQALILH
jgi:solute carrier family 36 (proton-coupled amino acid transporter)